MSSVNKIIAVCGNAGSYKTVTSVNLAVAIANKAPGASIAVVSWDYTKPLIPILFPGVKDSATHSLGRLLGCENLTHENIHKEMQMHGNIGFLGYNSGENIRSYPSAMSERIDEFLTQMRHLANYTIIDCTGDMHYRFTSKALITADDVLYLISCDINGLEFFKSQEPILLNEQYGYKDYIRLLTITGRFVHDEVTMKNAIGEIQGVIPYCDSIAEQWNQGNGLHRMNDAKYIKVINDIADAVMEVET